MRRTAQPAGDGSSRCALLVAACAGNAPSDADRACEGPGTGGPRVVYRAEPTPDAPRVTRAGVEQTIEVMCRRSRALGVARRAHPRGCAATGSASGSAPGPTPRRRRSRSASPRGWPSTTGTRNVIGNPDRPLPDLLRRSSGRRPPGPQAEHEDLPADGPDERTADRLNRDEQRIRALLRPRATTRAARPTTPRRAAEIVAGPETSCAGLAVALAPRGRPPRGASAAGDLDAAACARRLAGRGPAAGRRRARRPARHPRRRRGAPRRRRGGRRGRRPGRPRRPSSPPATT